MKRSPAPAVSPYCVSRSVVRRNGGVLVYDFLSFFVEGSLDEALVSKKGSKLCVWS